ncbi:MAG: GMC family oxidoreductase N-terminal domain-containing protein [Chromatiaceae bacterium]|nr:GMC family oxidoreductase N-terminal domain-containing protein [Gammaproteobacteria bacterium]MCP5300938.1 GMC family oxidoreductase N-terminal domain-containing protein [Chromatiaceae bacterium]MCP5421589.1 GMC family oxidoreductase N-terminal domain-containing protein [Chromatiaceae bacterium]
MPARERFACAAGDDDAFDYIVVGSGAGGGPLAANLARTGFRVLLLEAGGDEDSYDYQVPAFHARASEDPRYAWNFFVRHYADDDRQRRDDKFRPEQGGVLYPRAATLGGCTAHNAMILVYPHNSDWDGIAELTGDDSWRAETMRRYFERLERCEYDDRDPAARHGYRGWLTTNVVDPKIALKDAFVLRLVKGAVRESLRTLGNPITRLFGKLRTDLDPNDWRTVKDDVEGVCMTPLTTDRGRRVGSREYVQAVAAACPGNLVVRTHTLVTRVLLDDDNRATGVECLAGAHLYRADPGADSGDDSEPVRFNARREVILCAGAFNTPQLLKLSGIGPRAELERHGIPLRVDLPGVGENLQDRYEVTVVNRMRGNFLLMQDMQYRPPAPGEEPDPQFREWLDGKGPYTSNGAVVALLKRSTADKPEPDLFLFGLLGSFRGYYPGYSRDIAQGEDHFTWAVLKAHTHNRAGCVRLRSADPRDVPDIDFHYFNEGTDGGDDLAAVVEGVETVRRMADRAGDVIAEEIYPGREVADRAAVEAFIRDNAWGHHASCSCRMGPAGDAMAVVDSRFRVFGCSGLRVVDASVFPRIPGFFIVSAVYMISEKAADVIVEDAGVAARADA